MNVLDIESANWQLQQTHTHKTHANMSNRADLWADIFICNTQQNCARDRVTFKVEHWNASCGCQKSGSVCDKRIWIYTMCSIWCYLREDRKKHLKQQIQCVLGNACISLGWRDFFEQFVVSLFELKLKWREQIKPFEANLVESALPPKQKKTSLEKSLQIAHQLINLLTPPPRPTQLKQCSSHSASTKSKPRTGHGQTIEEKSPNTKCH